MKRLVIYILMVFADMFLFVSCSEPLCVPEGPFVGLYIKNASTHSVVVEHKCIAAVNLVSGQTSSVNYGSHYHAPLPEEGCFCRMSVYVDTATFTFDDGTVWKHYYTTDTTVLPYERLFVPNDGNIWDYSSWQTSDERNYTYTITEEDYQRALEQNDK